MVNCIIGMDLKYELASMSIYEDEIMPTSSDFLLSQLKVCEKINPAHHAHAGL